MPRKPPPGAPTLRRLSGTIQSEAAIFIYCEGETERAFLDGFRAHFRINRRLVQTFLGGEPRNCVELAARKLREVRRTGAEIWVVFDRDEHPHWASAIDRARQLQMKIGVSNPCFELWAILLHAEQRASLSHKEAQHKLKSIHPEYDHEKNPYLKLDLVLLGIESAETRCVELLRAATDNGDSLGNPTSRFHELVSSVRRRAVPG